VEFSEGMQSTLIADMHNLHAQNTGVATTISDFEGMIASGIPRQPEWLVALGATLVI